MASRPFAGAGAWMKQRTCLSIVLAAGEGVRMRSATPKVLHRVGGRSSLGHVLASLREAGIEQVAVVVGPGHDRVAAEVRGTLPRAEIFVQGERRGTAHAVLMAKEASARGPDDSVVIFGDT